MLTQLLIIQIITFVGLLFVLMKLLNRQLTVSLARLKRLYDENLERQEELKRQLEDVKLEREKELARAKEQADLILKDAKIAAEKFTDDTRLRTQEEAARVLDQGKADCEKMRREFEAQYHGRVVGLSAEIIRCAFAGASLDALHHQLINEVVEEIGKLDPKDFTIKNNQVKVISAKPLQDTERKKIVDILSGKVGMPVTLEEVADVDIVTGLVVRIGLLTIDGSLRDKLKKILQYLKKTNLNI
jgi:F-type H+-transporting ATPase subunit b